MHIMNSKIRTWFLEKIEGRSTPYNFNNAEKQHILKRLVDSEGLEKFLHPSIQEQKDLVLKVANR